MAAEGYQVCIEAWSVPWLSEQWEAITQAPRNHLPSKGGRALVRVDCTQSMLIHT